MRNFNPYISNPFHNVQLPSRFPGEGDELNVDLPGDEDNKDDDVDDDNKDEDKDEDEDEDNKDEDDKDKKDEDEDSKDDEDDDDAKSKKDKKLVASKKDDDGEDLVRVSYKEITTKYPAFFKDFPGLKPAFFREQEFSKRFANPQDADVALETVQAYEEMRETVEGGNAQEFLEQVKQVSDKTLTKFAGNFLDALYEVSSKDYIAITSPVIKNILRQVLKSGEKSGNKNLVNAAKVINIAVFEDDDLGPADKPRKRDAEDDDEDDDFKKDKQNFYVAKHRELLVDVSNSITPLLIKEVEKGIDPTNSLSSGIKKMLVEKIIQEVDKEVAADKSHSSRMAGLWKREERSRFSGALKDSIITAYLSRAKASIPKIRERVRKEALSKQKESDTDTRERLTNREKRDDVGKHAEGSSRQITVKDARKQKLSDADIIARS